MDTSSVMSFRRQREQDWAELAELLDQIDAHRGKLQSGEEAERLGVLYRRTTTHLSLIRSNPLEKRLESKIHHLVVRAHGHVYRPAKSNIAIACLDYFRKDFPAAVRQYGTEILVAWLLIVVGFIIGLGSTTLDPDLYYAIVPIEEARSPAAAIESLKDSLVSGRDSDTSGKSMFAGMLWQHNVRVALLSFALGAVAGFPTLILMLFNGMLLGAMSAVFIKAGLGTEWFAWLAGHGVTEILALVLAGAGGLALGRALLWPGALTRKEALQSAGKKSLSLVTGTVLMLLFAALLESFFRQSHVSTTTRYVVAAISGAFWLLYFLGADRLKFSPRPSGEDNY